MAYILENLIVNRFYKTKEIAQNKVNKAWAKNFLTDDEFDRLTDLTNQYYSTEE